VDRIHRKDRYHFLHQQVPELQMSAVLQLYNLIENELDIIATANVDTITAIIAVIILAFIQGETNNA